MNLNPTARRWLETPADDLVDASHAHERQVAAIEDAESFDEAIDALEIPDDLVVWLETVLADLRG